MRRADHQRLVARAGDDLLAGPRNSRRSRRRRCAAIPARDAGSRTAAAGDERAPACLATHTAAHRAALLESYVEEALAPTGANGRPRRARQLCAMARFPATNQPIRRGDWRYRAAMKLVVFGLSVSSSWGNGHAVLWRALIRALGERWPSCRVFRARRALVRTAPRSDRDRGRPAGAVWRVGRGARRRRAASWPTPMRRWSPLIARTASPRPSWCSRRRGCTFSTISTRR